MSGTHTFKIGDKVRCVESQSVNTKTIYAGYEGVVTHVSPNGYFAVDNLLSDGETVCWPKAFVLIQEVPTFNLKTQPWFIRVNSKEESALAQEWLFSQGINWFNSDSEILVYYEGITGFTNVEDFGRTRDYIMCKVGNNFKGEEIKLNFKTSIDSVVYPEVKTKQEVAIEELEATIELAKQQILKLKDGK